MKSPCKYTPAQIQKWPCGEGRTDIYGRQYWQPARPIHLASICSRIVLAWYVFIGKYDALDWHDR